MESMTYGEHLNQGPVRLYPKLSQDSVVVGEHFVNLLTQVASNVRNYIFYDILKKKCASCAELNVNVTSWVGLQRKCLFQA